MGELTERGEKLRNTPHEDRPACGRCLFLIVSLVPPRWRCERCLRYLETPQSKAAMGQGSLF